MSCRPGPVVHQVGGVDGADAGSKIPAHCCAVCGVKRAVRGGQHADRAASQVAVRADAVHVHITQGNVVENAGTGDSVPIARIARTAAARTVLGSGELIVDGCRIALRAAGLLIDERLDAGHDGRRKRSAARAGPCARIAAAGRSTVRSVRPAKHIEVAPQAIRGKQRDVRSVANAVVGITENSLPRRLWPSGTRAAHNTGRGWRASGALAGSAAARYRALHEGTEGRVIAQTG